MKSNESNQNKSQINQIKNVQNFHFISAHTEPIDIQYSSKVRSPEESSFFKTVIFSSKSRHFRRCAGGRSPSRLAPGWHLPEFLRPSEIVSLAKYSALFAALFCSKKHSSSQWHCWYANFLACPTFRGVS